MLATTVNYGVGSSSLCAESQIGITRRIRGTLKKQAPFIRGHLAGLTWKGKGLSKSKPQIRSMVG
jgi:hypothetical protein